MRAQWVWTPAMCCVQQKGDNLRSWPGSKQTVRAALKSVTAVTKWHTDFYWAKHLIIKLVNKSTRILQQLVGDRDGGCSVERHYRRLMSCCSAKFREQESVLVKMSRANQWKSRWWKKDVTVGNCMWEESGKKR